MAKGRGRRRAQTDDAGNVVQLVYARSGLRQHEPLVALVRTEEEAAEIEAQVVTHAPGARVMWETHGVVGGPTDIVHVVLLAAGGSGEDEAADPIGVAVFADRDDADNDVRIRREADPRVEFVVRTLPVGWRRDA